MKTVLSYSPFVLMGLAILWFTLLKKPLLAETEVTEEEESVPLSTGMPILEVLVNGEAILESTISVMRDNLVRVEVKTTGGPVRELKGDRVLVIDGVVPDNLEQAEDNTQAFFTGVPGTYKIEAAVVAEMGGFVRLTGTIIIRDPTPVTLTEVEEPKEEDNDPSVTIARLYSQVKSEEKIIETVEIVRAINSSKTLAEARGKARLYLTGMGAPVDNWSPFFDELESMLNTARDEGQLTSPEQEEGALRRVVEILTDLGS